MTDDLRHECSLAGILGGQGDEDGIRCAHGFLIRPGDQIESRHGTYTLGNPEPYRRETKETP